MLRDFDFIACFPCFCRLLHFTDKLIWFGKLSHFQTNWQKFRQPGEGWELTIRSLNTHICVSVSTVSRPGSLLLLETVPSCKDGKINIYSRCSDAHNTLLSRPTSGSRCNLQWPAAWPHRVHRQQWALWAAQCTIYIFKWTFKVQQRLSRGRFI